MFRHWVEVTPLCARQFAPSSLLLSRGRHGRTFLAPPTRRPPSSLLSLPRVALSCAFLLPPRREWEISGTAAGARQRRPFVFPLPNSRTKLFLTTKKVRKQRLTMPAQAPTPRITRNSRGLRSSPSVSSVAPCLGNPRVSRRRSSGTPTATNFVGRNRSRSGFFGPRYISRKE